MQVKFVDLGAQYILLREEILARFDELSRDGAYVLTPEVSKFEEGFAAYCGADYAVAVGNGSDALYLPLLCLNIGPGDEVITAPNSFVASAWVIAQTGASIVFSDVGEDMNLDPEKVEAAFSSRTKAIIPVHLTGRIANMEAIRQLSEKHGIPVIEDAAQAVGARRNGQRAGTFGLCAGFSLHPLKNLHVHGDGGIAVTNSRKLHEQMKKYRNHGLRNRNKCEFWGLNTRLDSIQAAIANIKLKYIDSWNQRYREIAARYTASLEGFVDVPTHESHEEPVYHRYMIRLEQRDALQQHLKAKGIDTAINYPIPLHLQPAAASLGYKPGDFPVAEKLANTILSIPVYPELSDESVDYVIEQIVKFVKKG
jgi:dTDP-4-amino-4,6-dideoxygalactose transaminase